VAQLALTQKSKAHLILEGLAPYALSLFVGYCAADLVILGVRDNFIPLKSPPAKPANRLPFDEANKGAFQSIISRNMFSVDGTIPEPLLAKEAKEGKRQIHDAPAVPSQLPLTLLGTLVHSNPSKSIATIELKGKNMTIAYVPQRDIENMATVVRVERNKVILRNLNNGRLEFIEIKANSKITFNTGRGNVPIITKGGEVKQVAPNQYKLSRSTIMKHTQDLSNLLMQASTIPRKKPNGEIDCYVLTSFKQDSIFSELAVQQGDCIKSANGEPVDSPSKAMEMYNMLKTQNNICLTVERDGRDQELCYQIE
jgi:general secretion pathway protein C